MLKKIRSHPAWMMKNNTSALKATSLALVLAFARFPAYAQESEEKEIPRYKWEIATDLLWLIDKNTAPRFSVFTRKNFSTKNGHYRAWRLRVGANYEWEDLQAGVDTSSYSRNWEYEVFLRPGYEWQKQLGKFQLNYGLDAHFRWRRTDVIKFEDFSGPSGQILDSRSIGFSQTWEWGLSGFIGAKYFISPRWSISAEANLTVIYQNFYSELKSYNIDIFTGLVSNVLTGYGRSDVSSLRLRFNPLYVLQVSYLFN